MSTDFSSKIINSASELSGISIIDFYADWCGPCQTYKPIFIEAARELSDRNFKFFIVNVDESSNFCRQQNIRAIPTIKIFDNNICIASYSGADKGKSQLVQWILENTSSI